MPENEVKALKEAKAEMNEARAVMKEAAVELREAKREVDAKSEAKSMRREMAREAEREIASRVITVMTTALAVVAGLFWQTAISDTIKNFIPVSGAWQYELGIAFAITVFAGAAIYFLSKSVDGLGKKAGA